MANTMNIVVRPCFEMDLQFVQLIYAHHVITGTGSFETEAPDLKEMTARWSKTVLNDWPYLVASAHSDPSRILGFAYAAPFRDRAAYAGTFEDSIYVAPNFMGRGIGGALLDHLLMELDTRRVREVVAMIGDSENKGSIKVHESRQFNHVGVLSGVGRKFNRWIDVVLMQRSMPSARDSA